MKNNSSNDTGMSFSAVLTLIFVVLKLCKVIDWSWWWVLSPLWISTILIIAIYFIAWFIYKRKRNRRKRK